MLSKLLGMLQVVQQLQSIPHSRADVEVLPDQEEVQDRLQLAMHTVDAISGPSQSDLSAVMQSAHVAATAAASASSLVRQMLLCFSASWSESALLLQVSTAKYMA